MIEPLTRLLDRIVVDPISDCWEFEATGYHGYGQFYLNGVSMNAHRASYLLFIGPVSSRYHVDHLCRNRACVNPTHLEAVTPRENTLRGSGPAAFNHNKTACVRGHRFNKDNTYLWSGKRICRRCKRLEKRNRRLKLAHAL